MDLYQIFVTHNRPWSVREITVFTVLFLFLTVLLFYLVRQKKILYSQAVAGIVLYAFLGIVFGVTVFARESNGIHQYELELFWSWKLAFRGDRAMQEEIFLNMLLLFPAGLLLPCLFHRRPVWWKSLLIGIGISAVIETGQLVMCRGLFELDDMLHNGLGCMAGSCVAGIIRECQRNFFKV